MLDEGFLPETVRMKLLPSKNMPQENVHVAGDMGCDPHLAIRPVAPSNKGVMSFAAR